MPLITKPNPLEATYTAALATAGNSNTPLQQRIQAATEALTYAILGKHAAQTHRQHDLWSGLQLRAQAQLDHLTLIADTQAAFLRTQNADLLNTEAA